MSQTVDNANAFEEDDDVINEGDLDDLALGGESTVGERLQRAAEKSPTRIIHNWNDTPVNVTPSGRHEVVEFEDEDDDSEIDMSDVPEVREDITLGEVDDLSPGDTPGQSDTSRYEYPTGTGAEGPATLMEQELDASGTPAPADLNAGPMTMASFDMANDDTPDETDDGTAVRVVEDASMADAVAEMEAEAGSGVREPEVIADMDPDMHASAVWESEGGATDEENLAESEKGSSANAEMLLDSPQQSQIDKEPEKEEGMPPEEDELDLNANDDLDLGASDSENDAPSDEPAAAEEVPGPAPQEEEEPEPAAPVETVSEPVADSEQTSEEPTVGDDSGAPLGRGLDVGTANLVASRMDEEGGIEFFPARNAFLDVQEDPYTLKMLKGQGVPFIKRDNRLFIIGEDAFELANIFNREMRRPMKNGLISPTDVDAMPMEVELFKKILGPPRAEGEPVYYSVPADPVDSTMNIVYHENIVNGLLDRLGYRGVSFNEGLAIVFSELADDEFTGIGISCGGGMVNVCVAFRSMNVISFSTSKGGDWIDQQAAQVMGCAASKITSIKERGVDINAPKTPEEEAIVIYYRALIKYSLDNIIKKFEATKDIPNFPKPVPIAVSGGTSKVGGFVEVFKDEFSKLASRFPIQVSDIRRAEDQLNATSKGCLIAALSEG